MNKLSTIFFVLFALTAFGCGDDAEPAAGAIPVFPDAGVSPTPGCGTGPACTAGDICRSGMCVPNTETCNPPCAMGEVCDRATLTCGTEEDGSCQNDAQCAVGFCIDQRCQDVDCVTDINCPMGEYCENNRCFPATVDCADGDGDGYGVGPDCLGIDCDDTNPNVNPAIRENGELRCDDDIDDDCDGTPALCGDVDNDRDGVTVRAGDCDDNDPDVNTERAETPYNGKDDDCDESTSDTDVDGDGFAGNADGTGEDCNDRDVTIYPGAPEIAGDTIDQDCDGEDRMPTAQDVDMDGFSEEQGDCDDNDATINPDAPEVTYNGKDDDCDEMTRDDDLDMDGFVLAQDCDDNDRAVNPDIEEIYYNGVDDDCDETTVDDDADADGFAGNADGTGVDCNDQSAAVNPDAMETPYNGADDDCRPETKDDDLDDDGFPLAEDCNDDDALINPSIIEDAETNCDDGIDNNCVGGDVACDLGAIDTDMDGIPDDQDCEPMNADIPGPGEIVNNGLDDDCDPTTPDVCEDDIFDTTSPNGAAGLATPVSDGDTRVAQYGALQLCTADSDWYSITVPQGSGLEVDLFFDHSDGDLDARLFQLTEDGEQFIDFAISVTDNETLYVRRSDADAVYLIEVFSFDATSPIPYSMGVNVFNDCVDDAESGIAAEHNDSAEEAG